MTHLSRRTMVQGLFALASAGTLAACNGQAPQAAAPETPATSPLTYTSSHRALMDRLADIIIPKTDTVGATEAGAVEVMERVLVEWMSPGDRNGWLAGLDQISQYLESQQSAPFLDAASGDQVAAVSALDRAAYERGGAPDFYKEFKTALGAAFYLSEAGATEELRYEAVPGEWIACLPFEEVGRTWAV
ncbi:MAG: gluconate 2-dehydrogenase subunit 3 family protein [Pseudomonadota bacterium]